MVTEKEKVQNIAEDITAKHTYVLVAKNDRRGMTYDEKNNLRKDPEYPRQRNLLLKSSIIWDGRNDPFSGKPRAKGKYIIRYYDGCTTLFIDDQPKEKDTIEQLVRSTRDLFFQNGYLHIYGYDSMLKTYVDWASWNDQSPYKVPTVDSIYTKRDADEQRKIDAASVDEIEEALKLAKTADEKKMLIHSKFLDVPEIDSITGNKLSPESIRTEYRKSAMNDAKRFLRTYNDKTMAFRVWIEELLSNGTITTTLVPNQAAWKNKGKVICDISGLKTNDVILNKLVEHSQTDDGKEFREMLEALYK